MRCMDAQSYGVIVTDSIMEATIDATVQIKMGIDAAY